VLRLRTPPFTTKRLIAVISDVAFSPDGSLLATTGGLGDGTVRLWDAKNGRQVGAPLYQSGIPTLASPLLTVAFSADGKWLAAGGHDEVVLLSVKNRGPIGRAQQVRTLPRATRAANGLAFSPDGTRLAVATSDGTTRVWDLAPQRSRERLLLAAHGQGRWDLALSPDGRRLATIGPDGTGVWDVETGRTLITQPAVNQPLSSLASVHLAVSPDGTRLAAAGLNRPPVVLDATTNRQTRTLPGRPAADLALSPDGSHLATAGPDGTRLWDAASGRTIRTLPDPALRQAVSFSPDGRLLATGGGSDGAIRIWDLATDKQQSVLAYTTSPATSTVLHLTFSPDGRRLAATILNTGAGSSVVPASETDGTVLVWEVETGKQQLTLRQDHPGGIFDAAFSPNGARLATAGLDGTVRLWDSHTGAQLITVTQSDSPVRAVAFSADGRLLASLAEDGIVRFDVVPVEDLIALAHQRVTRGFTDDECRRYLHLDRCPDR